MIEVLRGAISTHPTKFTVLGGDFNFVERAEDTTSEFKAEKRPQWDLLLDEHNLADCTSDLHSFFHKAGCGNSKTHGRASVRGPRGLTVSTFRTLKPTSRLSNR